jgi:hypothetical protein
LIALGFANIFIYCMLNREKQKTVEVMSLGVKRADGALIAPPLHFKVC